MDIYKVQEIIKTRNIEEFALRVLGIPFHEGHVYWINNSTKIINILKPANQWGKTTIEAVKHIYHAVCKPKLDRFNPSFETWINTRYQTLNFGKTYEVAKGVMEAVIDITNGNYMLGNGQFNKSMLQDWAITQVLDTPKLPKIKWFNKSETLIRSYDGLGTSFKRMKLAFISGDECGDIPELQLFLNGTLLPRISFFRGNIDLVGTSQPKGLEYEQIAEIAEKDVMENGKDSYYFILSYNSNEAMASVYVNKFMPSDFLEKIESVADPEMRKQIIYGQYVDYSKHLYTWDEVNNMFRKDIPYNAETGLSEVPIEGEYYVFSTDMAASEDETSCTCLRYNIRKTLPDGTFRMFPAKIVFHKAWKGNVYPLSLQYEMIIDYFMKFKTASPLRTKFLYDAGSLGGKNAEQAFRKLNGVPFPPKGRSYAEIKAEMFGKVKFVLGKGREFEIGADGKLIDKNPEWGGIRASSQLKELKRQLEVASVDDKKLKNDQFTSLGMAIHYIEARAPKIVHTRAVSFNYNRGIMR